MSKNKTRGFLRRFFSSTLFLVVGGVVLILIGAANVRVYYQSFKIRQEIASMQDEIENLSDKKLKSMQILKYVMSDGFVEAKARTELNLQRPDEHVMVVKGQKTEVLVEPMTAETETGQQIANPLKWWYYFIHKSPTSVGAL